MATLKINGDTSGYVELVSPAVAGSTSIALDKILVADSSGNVGIGTSSPTAKLDVVAPSSAEAINIRGRSADDIGQLKFYENDGTTSLARLDARTTHFEVGAYNELRFSAGGVGNSHIVIDTSGNVGIGVAPVTSWDSFTTLQIQGSSLSGLGENNTVLGSNLYHNSNAWKYYGTGAATLYQQRLGEHRWFGAASGTAGNTASVAQHMTIDSSGNVSIGTTGDIGKLTVQTSSSALHATTLTKGTNTPGIWVTTDNNDNNMSGIHLASGGGTHFSSIVGARTANTSHWGTHLAFYTHTNDTSALNTATEKMRINGNGHVTMPNQPCAWVTGTGDYVAMNNELMRFTVSNNETGGSNYSTSSKLYTCPVAGWYECSAHALTQSSQSCEFQLKKNGTTVARRYVSSGRGISAHNVVYCSANDTLGWFWASSGNVHYQGGVDAYSSALYRLVG